jgi:hypothetical protein
MAIEILLYKPPHSKRLTLYYLGPYPASVVVSSAKPNDIVNRNRARYGWTTKRVSRLSININ